MLFPKEHFPAERRLLPVKTDVQHIGDGFTLITILLRTDTEAVSSFSIAVSLFDGTSAGNDARLIQDVTVDAAEADRLFRLLVLGTVTPCTLSDVLEDLL